MTFFSLQPEVAGGLGPGTVLDSAVHPPKVTRLNYELAGWLGDDLLETYPCYLVTERLGRRLDAEFDGVALDEVEVTIDAEAEELFPNGPPMLHWLQISGQPGRSDLGLTREATLVVSDRVMRVLQEFTLDHCDIDAFDAG